MLARTDQPGATGESLAERALVAKAIRRYQASGVWQEGHDLYYAVAAPLTQGFDLHGFLVTGFAITDEPARAAMRVSGTEVAIVANRDGAPEVAATTLDADRASRLVAELRLQPDLFARVAGRGEVAEGVELTLGGEPWIAHLAPLVDAGGKPVGATVALASLDRELAPYREIERALLIAGVSSVLLAFAFTFAFARRALRPVRRLAAAASAARAGDYDQRIPSSAATRWASWRALSTVCSASCARSATWRRYVAELSRNLPEAGEGRAVGADPGRPPPPRPPCSPSTSATCPRRGARRPGRGRTPGAVLDALSRNLRRLVNTAAAARAARGGGRAPRAGAASRATAGRFAPWPRRPR